MDKSVLKKATSDKPEPTQGHLYRDIAQMTYADASTSQKMCDWLLDRMKKSKSCHQITKSLKVIRHVAQQGHPDFQKSLQKSSDDLRNYTKWNGPRDPIHDDKLNEGVRQAAKDAFDAIFSEQHQSKVKNSLEGLGANTRDPMGSGGIGGGMSDGFRETDSSFKPKSNKLAEAMAKKAQESNQPQGMLGRFGAAVGNLAGYGSSATPDAQLFARMEASMGGAPLDQTGSSASTGPPVSPMPGGAASPAGGMSPKWGFTQEGAGAPEADVKVDDREVLTPMQKVVHKYTSLKNAPQRSEISAFNREVAALEADEEDVLAERLDEKLDQKQPWQTRLNALTIVESLLKAAATPEVSEYFSENPEDIQKNVNVIQSTVKDKAKKVLALLKVPEVNARNPGVGLGGPVLGGGGVQSYYADPGGVDGADVMAAAAAAAPTGADPTSKVKKSKKSDGTSKLKKRSKKTAAAAAATAEEVPVAPPAGGGGGDLFASLDVHSSFTPAPAAAAAAAPAVEQPLQQQQPPPAAVFAAPAAPSGGAASPLSQFLQQAPPAAAAAPPAVPTPALAAQPALPLQPTRSVDDLFGAPAAAVPPAAAATVAGGGGYEGLFDTTPNPVPTPHATPVAQAPPAAFDFAALSGLGGGPAAAQAQASSSPPQPPTPVQSPVVQQGGAMPAVGGAAGGQQADLMAALQAQQAQIMAQIAALQAQQQPAVQPAVPAQV